MLRLVDTHAHLDEIENLEEALHDAAAAGVAAIIAVGSDYESNRKTLECRELRQPGLSGSGLHPSQLGLMDETEVARVLQQIEENLNWAVAIGEVGLDYHKRVISLASKDRQQAVLAKLVGLAGKSKKPVIVHSRYAWKDALSQVTAAGIDNAVFHWYTGPSMSPRVLMEDITSRQHRPRNITPSTQGGPGSAPCELVAGDRFSGRIRPGIQICLPT